MRKILFVFIGAMALLVTANTAFALVDFYDLRSNWETDVGGFSDVNLVPQVDENETLTAGSNINLPGGNTLSFDIGLEGRQVPDSWLTWSGDNEPRVLYTSGSLR